ncbi:MAG TPA: Clp protease N-terminal domain-containing protein [Fimbriimonadaceae bacterium]|nr:Clp protease N-terminal domain-containing protein [Fimbriimonadaceae bacterium]
MWQRFTEHILLGLIRERNGVAAKALGSLGVSETSVLQARGELEPHQDNAEPDA